VGPPIPNCTKWWGADRHILAYFITSRRDEAYLMSSVSRCVVGSRAIVLAGRPRHFIAAFAHFHFDLRRIVEASAEMTVWPIYDRDWNDLWTDGRDFLLADACHSVGPYMAAGGSIAIEDAVVLSRCLAACDDPYAAFRRYKAIRIPRVADLQRISIENSWMLGPTETDWFFCYDATIAALDARAGPDTGISKAQCGRRAAACHCEKRSSNRAPDEPGTACQAGECFVASLLATNQMLPSPQGKGKYPSRDGLAVSFRAGRPPALGTRNDM
jgi:2-polyprenyl-6-methoxyphenol hydroxylase-like FAD-dependent oxidoreductase